MSEEPKRAAQCSAPDTVHECHNMAASDSARVSKLDTLQRQLDLKCASGTDSELAKTKSKFAALSDSELHAKIERLEPFLRSGKLNDGGDRLRKERELLSAEVQRRKSKDWLHKVSPGCKRVPANFEQLDCLLVCRPNKIVQKASLLSAAQIHKHQAALVKT